MSGWCSNVLYVVGKNPPREISKSSHSETESSAIDHSLREAVLLSWERLEQAWPGSEAALPSPPRASVGSMSSNRRRSCCGNQAPVGGGTVRNTSLRSDPNLPARGREVKGLALSSRACRLEYSTAMGSTSLTSD